MQNGEPKGWREVDTLRVALLGFSLISIIIISLSVFYIFLHSAAANCFNLGRTESESTIVISAWLVNHLDADELKAVLIHEMAHTKNRV